MGDSRKFIDQSAIESTKLAREITFLIDNYLEKSEMPHNQKIVNAGRALNAAHVDWIQSLKIQTDHKNLSILASLPESVRLVRGPK